MLCSDSELLKLFSVPIVPALRMPSKPPLIVPILVRVVIVAEASLKIPCWEAPPLIMPRLVIVPINSPFRLRIPVPTAEEIVPELTIDVIVTELSMPDPAPEVTLIEPSTIKDAPGAGEET